MHLVVGNKLQANPDKFQAIFSAAAILTFFHHPNSNFNKMHPIQVKGMNLRNMNIGDANVTKLDTIGELTLYFP